MTCYYAHSTKNKNKSDWQTLKKHSIGVAKLASEFGDDFKAPCTGHLVGLVHDLGKYSEEAQRIFEDPSLQVDHSTAGAKEIIDKFSYGTGLLLSYACAGHHSGLPDGDNGSTSSLLYRTRNKELTDFSAYKSEIEIPITMLQHEIPRPFHKKKFGFSLAFYIRMIFSCLVDADSLDTEEFYSTKRADIRKNIPKIEDLSIKFQKTINELRMRNVQSPSRVNTIRSSVLERCITMSFLEPGFYSFTGPTGVGKTYSCMAFAINHARKYKKKRIIYAIHYTSVGEQNADLYRGSLGADSVLEHHSNFEYPKNEFYEWDDDSKRNLLASENWDMPLVVTTTLQFFESLFSNKRSRCRKLHNYANSVIILDEAQLMQIDFLVPCLWALTELVKNYGATVIFCSATQPNFKKLLPIDIPITEIIENPEKLSQDMKRVSVRYAGLVTDDKLTSLISSKEQSLCIVNSRKHAYKLFSKLESVEKDKESCFLLYNRMCSENKKEIIRTIKERLKEGLSCKVISTSLIEVGVDVDFPYVYRSLTGIDSLIQSAGRCNREGKRCNKDGNLIPGEFIIFKPEGHGMPKKGRFIECADISSFLIGKYGTDILSVQSTNEYFDILCKYENNSLDTKNIIELTTESQDKLMFPFKEISDRFRMIEDNTFSIVIPYSSEAEICLHELEDAVKNEKPVFDILRKLQSFVVHIYENEFYALKDQKKIDRIGDEIIWYLADKEMYNSRIGLKDITEEGQKK